MSGELLIFTLFFDDIDGIPCWIAYDEIISRLPKHCWCAFV